MGDQHSTLRVKLLDLIEGMDFQSDEQSSFLKPTVCLEVMPLMTSSCGDNRCESVPRVAL